MGAETCPGAVRLESGRAYRRRQPEGTLLYRAVQENLATLREESSEVEEALASRPGLHRDDAVYIRTTVARAGKERGR
jgi:hypothetical protein